VYQKAPFRGRSRPLPITMYKRTLADYLAARSDDFIEMEWTGNVYTNEGREYPVVNVEALKQLIEKFNNETQY
jgi:hypothetical protein